MDEEPDKSDLTVRSISTRSMQDPGEKKEKGRQTGILILSLQSF